MKRLAWIAVIVAVIAIVARVIFHCVNKLHSEKAKEENIN